MPRYARRDADAEPVFFFFLTRVQYSYGTSTRFGRAETYAVRAVLVRGIPGVLTPRSVSIQFPDVFGLHDGLSLQIADRMVLVLIRVWGYIVSLYVSDLPNVTISMGIYFRGMITSYVIRHITRRWETYEIQNKRHSHRISALRLAPTSSTTPPNIRVGDVARMSYFSRRAQQREPEPVAFFGPLVDPNFKFDFFGAKRCLRVLLEQRAHVWSREAP